MRPKPPAGECWPATLTSSDQLAHILDENAFAFISCIQLCYRSLASGVSAFEESDTPGLQLPSVHGTSER